MTLQLLQDHIELPISSTSGRRRIQMPSAYGTGQPQITIVVQPDIFYIGSNEIFEIEVSHRTNRRPVSGAYQTMLASEAVLARDWGQSDEDEAWASL